jgi:surfeit locus 1 family protein
MWRFIAGRRPLPLFSRSVWQTTRTYASPSFVPSKQPRPRPSMAKLAFVGFFPIAAFGLGTWQMKRLRWKVELIEMLEERVSLPAVPLPRRIR